MALFRKLDVNLFSKQLSLAEDVLFFFESLRK